MSPSLNEEIERYRRLYEQKVVDDAFVSYGEALRRGGKLGMALQICREGLASYPHNLNGQILLSRIYLDMGHYQNAHEEIQRVLEKSPDSFMAILTLVRILIKQKAFNKARTVLEKLDQTFPSHPEVKKIKRVLSDRLETVDTSIEYPRKKKESELSPSQRARILADFLNKEPNVIDFYIVPTFDTTDSVEILPSHFKDIRLHISTLIARFKDVTGENIVHYLVENEDGVLLIEPFKETLLIIRCKNNVKVGKIRMVIRDTMQHTT